MERREETKKATSFGFDKFVLQDKQKQMLRLASMKALRFPRRTPASRSYSKTTSINVVSGFDLRQRYNQALLSPKPTTPLFTTEQDQVGPTLAMNQSRDDALMNMGHVVDELCKRKGAWMSNAACRMLLGAPGLGKSRMLQSLAYTSVHKHPNLVPVYVDCTSPTMCQLPPSHLLWHALKARRIPKINTTPKTLDGILRLMDRHHLLGLVLIDEADNIYRLPKPAAETYLHELSSIVGSQPRRLVAFLSGSQAWLPFLVGRRAAELPSEMKEYYPASSFAPKINGQKLQPIRVNPFHSEDNFKAMLDALAKEHSQPPSTRMTDNEINSLMWVTGGNPRLMYSPIKIIRSFPDHNLNRAYDCIAAMNDLQVNDYSAQRLLSMSPFKIQVDEVSIRKVLDPCDFEYLLDNNRLVLTREGNVMPTIPIDLLRYLCHTSKHDYRKITTGVQSGLTRVLEVWPGLSIMLRALGF